MFWVGLYIGVRLFIMLIGVDVGILLFGDVRFYYLWIYVVDGFFRYDVGRLVVYCWRY